MTVQKKGNLTKWQYFRKRVQWFFNIGSPEWSVTQDGAARVTVVYERKTGVYYLVRMENLDLQRGIFEAQ